MTTKINNFDILKRMSAENKSIMLCPDVLNMKYSQKAKGTSVEVGVPGNPIGDIFSGAKKAVLLIWDVQEFEKMKRAMEREVYSADEKVALEGLLIPPEDEYTPRDTEQNAFVVEAFRRGQKLMQAGESK